LLVSSAPRQDTRVTGARAQRADAERTVLTILEAAERVLRDNPAASMERIAEEAGVARTTVHRRFATREALIDALAAWANTQFEAAVNAAHPETAPPLVALYQATVNVLRVKIGWGFAMTRASSSDPDVARVQDSAQERCLDLFIRLRDIGTLRADVDPVWAFHVYHALIHATVDTEIENADPDQLATRLVDTLLRGVATEGLTL
jgi:AcrR family transcriptional regulator